MSRKPILSGIVHLFLQSMKSVVCHRKRNVCINSCSVVYLLVHLLTTSIPPSHQTDEIELHAYLLTNYTPFARPVLNSNDAVLVTLGYELKHIVSIVESEQTITQKVWLRMSWKNELMTWKPEEWGGIDKSRLSYSQVWTPDIFLQEDVSSDMSTGPEKYKTQVQINSDGTQYWYVPTLFQSSCIFEVANFPFDKQSCTLMFTPWTHSQNELDLKVDQRPVVTSNYVNSSEWELVSVSRERRSSKYACCPNPFVDIRYTTHLRRKPLYYVYSVIVPCIIQMIIILFTFFLPPDSGERIGVVITVLLVFAVYLEVLSNTLPRTSTSTPALSKFYIAAMAESACSLIATCLVLIIHFKGTEKGVGPMPKWARKYFIDGMAAFLCVRVNIREHSDEGLLAMDGKGSYNNMHLLNGKLSNQQNEINMNEECKKVREDEEAATMDTLVAEVRVITALINDQNRQDEIEEEWQILGKVFDRLFFMMFFIIFVVSSLVLLLPVYMDE